MSRNRINEGFKMNRASSSLYDIEQEVLKPKKIKNDFKKFQAHINRMVIVCNKCLEACKLPNDDINNKETREVIDNFKLNHKCQTK